MRLNSFVIAAAFATVPLAIPAAGQALTNGAAAAATSSNSGPLTMEVIPFLSSKIGVPASGTNALQLTNFLAGPRLGRLKGLAAAAPTPGVYKTEPYACIVVVPGKYPDDRCVVNPGDRDFKMPVMRPELRFIPFHPK